MGKIRINLGDLETALLRSGLTSYSDDKDLLEVEIEVIQGDDPGDGKIVDTLMITMDKQEKTYNGGIEDVRHIVEVFPSNRPELENRITTQKSTTIKRAIMKKKNEDDIPF